MCKKKHLSPHLRRYKKTDSTTQNFSIYTAFTNFLRAWNFLHVLVMYAGIRTYP